LGGRVPGSLKLVSTVSFSFFLFLDFVGRTTLSLAIVND